MLGFVPHELKLLRLGSRYSNFKPRDPVEFRQGDSEKYKEHIEKLGSMHHNGVEVFPLFAATIVSTTCTPVSARLGSSSESQLGRILSSLRTSPTSQFLTSTRTRLPTRFPGLCTTSSTTLRSASSPIVSGQPSTLVECLETCG